MIQIQKIHRTMIRNHFSNDTPYTTHPNIFLIKLEPIRFPTNTNINIKHALKNAPTYTGKVHTAEKDAHYAARRKMAAGIRNACAR